MESRPQLRAVPGNADRTLEPFAPPLPSLLEPVAALTRTAFWSLTRFRGASVFHPTGTVMRATVTIPVAQDVGASLFDTTGSYDAIVRRSRGIGLPQGLPDVAGLAIKIPSLYGPGLDQDFLLASCGSTPIGRRVLMPVATPDPLYSSILPLRVGRRRVLLGALPLTVGRPRGRRRPLAAFTIAFASTFGPWQTVGRLEIQESLPEAESTRYDFDAWNTGGGVEPAGLLNALRAPAYEGSRDARR